MRITKDDYENLISSLTSIYNEEAIDERSLFYKIAEYVKALLHHTYSVSLDEDEHGNEVRIEKHSGTNIGNKLIEELKSIEDSENIELEATYKKALTELAQVAQKLNKLLTNQASEKVLTQLEEIKDIPSDKIPIRENKAILVHTKLIALIHTLLKKEKNLDLSNIVKILDGGQLELLETGYFEKFLKRYKHWRLKNNVNPWEAWQKLASITMVVDNDIDNQERLQKIGADNLVIEDNARLSDEVNTILSGDVLNKREQIPQKAEVNSQFGLFHRFIIRKLQDDKAKLEVEERLQTPSNILECGKLKIDIDKCNLFWEGVVYPNIKIKNRSIAMLIILLKKKENLVKYSDIIESIDKDLSPLDDALAAQQYKAELVNDLGGCGVPKEIAEQIRNMIVSIRSQGFKATSFQA